MAIPHQFIFGNSGGCTVPPTPPTPEIIPTLFECYPLAEATESASTSSAAWQGVAQSFLLQPLEESYHQEFSHLWVQFYTKKPAVAGYRFKIGLYAVSDNDQNESTLVAMSNIKSSIGADGGWKHIRIDPIYSGRIVLDGSVQYRIALFTDAFYTPGEIVFKCKPYSDWTQPFKSSHVTSPPAANVNTDNENLVTLRHEDWISDKYLWFGVCPPEAATEESLP